MPNPFAGYCIAPQVGDEVILNDFGRQMTSANPKRGTRYKIVAVGEKESFDFGERTAPTVSVDPVIADNRHLLSVYFSLPKDKKHGTRLG